MKRREFITLLGGAAGAWPLAARGQQSAMPVVGFLNSGSPVAFGHVVSAFRQGLAEAGYVEHRNVGIEYRWAEGQVDRLPAFARELVRAQVAVICAGSPPAALAAKAASTTIPIVFTSGEDPIKLGLVASYNRPGGNVTGVALLIDVLSAKRLGLLREIVPATTLIAVLLNPTWATFDTQLKDVQEAARAVGQQIQVLRANTEREIDAAFDTAKEVRASAMMVGRSTRCTADDLRPARIHGCRWPDELRNELYRGISPGRRLQRQNFGRRETGRAAGCAISQVRAADQPQGRQVARAHLPAWIACHRRRGDRVKRRNFITMLGGAAAAWPLAASAQQSKMPLIGFLHIASLETRRNQVVSFNQGLKDSGYIEGQNVAIQYRWAENQNDRLPGLATDLVRDQVDVIAGLSTPSVLAAKNATTTIPIVFLTNGDPVKFGLVDSLNRP